MTTKKPPIKLVETHYRPGISDNPFYTCQEPYVMVYPCGGVRLCGMFTMEDIEIILQKMKEVEAMDYT